MTDPTTTGDPRDTIAIIHEPDGWLISATVGGAVFSTPAPLSAAAARRYLALLVPELATTTADVRLDPAAVAAALRDLTRPATGTVRVGTGPRPPAGTGCSPPGARCGWSSASCAPGWSSPVARPSTSAGT